QDRKFSKEFVAMLFPVCGSKNRSHLLLFLAACFCSLWFAGQGFSQQTTPPAPTVANGEKVQSDTDIDKAKRIGTQPAEPPAVLQQLNSAIEQLTARISPAVVQILVTS